MGQMDISENLMVCDEVICWRTQYKFPTLVIDIDSDRRVKQEQKGKLSGKRKPLLIEKQNKDT